MAEPIRNDSHLAALLGVSRAMVSRHKAMGMPTSSLEVARDWRAKNLNTAQRKDYNHARNWHAKKTGTPSAGTGDASSAPDRPEGAHKPDGYEDHRARREKADADRAEVLALREAEQVLLREGAERATFDAFRGLRDAAFQAMRDVTPKVRDLTEPREIQLALEAELRSAFANFEETSRRRLADLAAEARR